MRNKKKAIFNTIFLILIFSITVYMVFKGEDLGEIIHTVRQADPVYLLVSVVCVVLFILGESVIIFYMMRTLGAKVKMGHCALYSFCGILFSAVSHRLHPADSQCRFIFMKKDKLPIPVTTLVLMIVTITYKAVLVVIGIVIWIFGRGFLEGYLGQYMWVFYLGVGLNIFCVTFMMILVFAPGLAKWIMVKGLKLIEHFRFLKPKTTRLEKLEASMDQYHETAAFWASHKLVILKVLLITMVQRILLFTVTYWVYRSLGFHGYSIITLTILQSVISVSVDMLPLPGGMGISESLYLVMFAPVFRRSITSCNAAQQRNFLLCTDAYQCSDDLCGVFHNRKKRTRRKVGGENMFLGIYDYTVILTYISLGISVFGITRALEGDFKVAIFCLALSGLCDMFDGKIARTKKNRTDDEKNFGIQIDSLCDVVCFGIFPAMICYCLGVNTPAGIGALIFYSVASVIRLAYFNVSEAKRQNETSENRQYYQGLPITSMAIILPSFI